MRLASGQQDGKKTAFSICNCVDFRVAPAVVIDVSGDAIGAKAAFGSEAARTGRKAIIGCRIHALRRAFQPSDDVIAILDNRHAHIVGAPCYLPGLSILRVIHSLDR